jgi:Phospholipase_D-nuclease N-terminal
MPIAADYPFLEVFWTMVIFFVWVAWIWMLVAIFGDLFRRRDVGGWAKAAWCVFLIVVPFLGVLVYLIAQHDGMAQRSFERVEAADRQLDQRITAVAGAGGDGAAGEIERAEQLLARGTISQVEFETLKEQALAR